MKIKVIASTIVMPELFDIYHKQIFSIGEELVIDESFIYDRPLLMERIKYFFKNGAIKEIKYHQEQMRTMPSQIDNRPIQVQPQTVVVQQDTSKLEELNRVIEEQDKTLKRMTEVLQQTANLNEKLVGKMDKLITAHVKTISQPITVEAPQVISQPVLDPEVLTNFLNDLKDTIKNMPTQVVYSGGSSPGLSNRSSNPDEPDFVPGFASTMTIEQGEVAPMDIKQTTAVTDMKNIKDRLSKLRGEVPTE